MGFGVTSSCSPCPYPHAFLLPYSVVDLDAAPQVGTVVDKGFMDWVDLVRIVRGFVSENKRQRKIVGMIDHGTTRFGGCANISSRDVADVLQRFKTGTKSRMVVSILGVFKPEKNGMNKHR